jgi:hypothetical protein
MQPLRESFLLAPVSRFVRERLYTRQEAETPFFEHRIDLYAFSPRDVLTVAVELKLKKWRRALEQAVIYQLCADLVYVALPESAIAVVDKSIFMHHGVGLIAVLDGERCAEVVPAQQSAVLRPHYREFLVGTLMKRVTDAN